MGLFIVCLGIFVSLLFLLVHWYLKETAEIDFKLWDVETVTASDFTVEFGIPEAIWEDFNRTELPKLQQQHPTSSVLMLFEEYITEVLTKKLNAFEYVVDNIDCKVANISFAYDTPELLKLLT